MHIYLEVNVENLKLHEPSMLDQEEDLVLPTIQNLVFDAQVELTKDNFAEEIQNNQTRVVRPLANWVEMTTSMQC